MSVTTSCGSPAVTPSTNTRPNGGRNIPTASRRLASSRCIRRWRRSLNCAVAIRLGSKRSRSAVFIRRSIPAAEGLGVSRRYACWLDVLGIDSGYDYDPVWRTCQELGYAVTFHSAAENYGLRNSISNFVFNHIGHFGEAGNAVCKALFLGGVTRRFPQMQFAFLEGGVPCGPAASFPN